jgi:ATP-dependent helicase/nuclease subunit A
VLDAANTVFSNIMSTELGELDYDENAALKPGAVYRGDVPAPELICFALPEAADDDERPDKTALEAAAVARRIRRLISDRVTVTDRGTERPVGFGDIAVLLRSVKVTGGIYRREFVRAGIPVLSDQSGGFFQSMEVSVLLSLLAVIDNPRQDVPLISVLRSPLFGFTADELSAVRVCDRQGDFFSALVAAAQSDPKCAAFLETLGGFRRFAPDAELGALIRGIYDQLGCMAIAAAAADGAARRKNLMLLFELARKFEQSGYRGLHRFIGWLRAMEERGEEPRTGSECDGGAVRIMSVHKSKGLEFPVVFLCDTARQFNKADARGSVLVHPVLGLGPKLTDAGRGIEYPTLAWRAVASRMLRETLSEEMRLLYVAMTRARERLYITCSLADPAQTIDKLSRSVTCPMAPQALFAMSSPAQWLIAAALADGEKRLRLAVEPGDGKAERPEERSVSAEAAPAAEAIDLAPRLDWIYPHSAAVLLPSKITATELKPLGAEDPESTGLLPPEARIFRRPVLAGTAGRLGAAEKGSAAHLALRYLDFAKTGSPQEIAGELARLREAGFLSGPEADTVDPGALFRLFASDLGARMRAARAPMREFPFTLLCPARELFPGGGDDELLLQGVVDCCIEADGVLTVIDYKTDHVAAEDVSDRAARYELQLRTYAYALRRITGKPVGECILYFLNPGTAFSLPPAPEK